jgi:hypothetical protein
LFKQVAISKGTGNNRTSGEGEVISDWLWGDLLVIGVAAGGGGQFQLLPQGVCYLLSLLSLESKVTVGKNNSERQDGVREVKDWTSFGFGAVIGDFQAPLKWPGTGHGKSRRLTTCGL